MSSNCWEISSHLICDPIKVEVDSWTFVFLPDIFSIRLQREVHNIMNFTTIALAFMAILTLQMATLAVSKHHGPSSPCGKTCMRRLLYNTAYSSAASGIGMVMDVYDTKSYCSTDATESLCPDWVRQTVSDIASEMTKEKFRMLGATPSVTHYSFVQEMADVSREAALLGMSWASKTVTGIGEHNQAQYDSMAWTLHHLQTTKSTKVHAKKLRKAIANHPAGEPTPGSLKLDQTILLGSDTPSYILGPLMGGPGPCLDAILCSPDVFAVISPMLVGALDKGVLRKDAFLLYLLESAHGTSKVKRGGKPGEIYSFECVFSYTNRFKTERRTSDARANEEH